MRSRALFFLVALVVWLMLTWPADPQEVLVGAAAAALVAALMGHLLAGRLGLLADPRRYFVFLFRFLPCLLWEVLKANFDVAYRVVSPRLPIRPGIVAVRTSLVSDIGLTVLSSSITLTPGTMTVDVDRNRGILYVHWIDVRSEETAEATRRIAGRFEPILRDIFEEGRRG